MRHLHSKELPLSTARAKQTAIGAPATYRVATRIAALLVCMGSLAFSHAALSQHLYAPVQPAWARKAAAPVPTNTDAATHDFTADAKSAVDRARSQTCPTTTVANLNYTSYVPNQRSRIIGQVVKVRALGWATTTFNLDQTKVTAVIDEVCSSAAIGHQLDNWRYAFQDEGARPDDFNDPNNEPDLLARMPPALLCYADNAGIEAFMRKIPLTYYPDSPRGRYEIEERWEKSELPKVETDAAQALSSSCRDWYQRIFFQPFFAQEAAKAALVAKFRSIFAVSGVAPGDQIVWEAQPGSDSSTAHPSYPDAEQFFNELNIAVENRAKPLAESLAFAPPTKGEFEKTADYELRLQQAHDAYDANQAKAAEHVGQQKFLSRYTTFNEFLGRPTISASRYDADSEKLTLTISSPNSPYSATAVFSLPPSAAQVVKPALEKISPHVLLGLRDGELTARVFALRVGDEVYSGPISEASNSPIRFGSAAAEQWPKTLAERAQERQQKENLRRQQEAAEIRREAATNPRLAYALNFPLADDPRCHALWSNAISFARLPSASEADWNRLTDKLMTGLSAMGCLPNH